MLLLKGKKEFSLKIFVLKLQCSLDSFALVNFSKILLNFFSSKSFLNNESKESLTQTFSVFFVSNML